MSDTMTAPPSLEWKGTDVDVTLIDAQLMGLWKEISGKGKGTGAARTHIYNLVVYAGPQQNLPRVKTSLEHLAKLHPSRAILLVADRPNPVTRVDAEVSIRCMATSESGNSLCQEQIVVTAHGRAADHLNSVVMPLLMPQLRTYLWWPGQPAFGHRTFHQLLSVADQLVIDSAEFVSPGDGMANLSRLCQARQGVNDLHWNRLATWREIVAQFFDGPTFAKYASGIDSISFEFGSGGVYERATAGTLLLVGWMATQMGWEVESTLDALVDSDQTLSLLAGERLINIDVHLRDAGKQARGRLLRIEIRSRPKGEPPARFIVERSDDIQHATVTTTVHEGPEVSRVVPLAGIDDGATLADELERAGHDPMYQRVVEMSSRLAGREIWQPV